MDVSTDNDSNDAVDVMVQEEGLLSQEESLEVEDNVDEEPVDYIRRTNLDLTMIGSDNELQKDYWEDRNADDDKYRYDENIESDDDFGIEMQEEDIAADMEEERGEYEREDMEEGGEDEREDEEEEMDEELLNIPVRKILDPAPIWRTGCAEKVKGGARCNFCKKFYKGGDSITSNISRHVRDFHRNKAEAQLMMKQAEKKKKKVNEKRMKKLTKLIPGQVSIASMFRKRRGLMDPLKEKKMYEALVQMTVMMNHPFSDVENHYFRNLLYIAEPNFICPSRIKLTNQFDESAEKVKEELKKKK